MSHLSLSCQSWILSESSHDDENFNNGQLQVFLDITNSISHCNFIFFQWKSLTPKSLFGNVSCSTFITGLGLEASGLSVYPAGCGCSKIGALSDEMAQRTTTVYCHMSLVRPQNLTLSGRIRTLRRHENRGSADREPSQELHLSDDDEEAARWWERRSRCCARDFDVFAAIDKLDDILRKWATITISNIGIRCKSVHQFL